MKRMGIVSLVGLLAVPGLALAQGKEKKVAAPKNLCGAGEEVVFACELAAKSAKVVSLCASKDLDETRGTLKYRFGKPGKLELEFPGKDSRARPQDVFTYGRYTRPQVSSVGLKFQNGGYTYEVLSESNNEEGSGGGTSFSLVVTPPGGAKATTLQCRKPVVDDLMLLEVKGWEPGEFWR